MTTLAKILDSKATACIHDVETARAEYRWMGKNVDDMTAEEAKEALKRAMRNIVVWKSPE